MNPTLMKPTSAELNQAPMKGIQANHLSVVAYFESSGLLICPLIFYFFVL